MDLALPASVLASASVSVGTALVTPACRGTLLGHALPPAMVIPGV